MSIVHSVDATGLHTIQGVRVWRVYARGVGSYTQSFSDWYDRSDVLRRLARDGVSDVIDVEPVT